MPERKSETTLKPIENVRKRDAIIEAIEKYDVSETAAWDKLDRLSTHTDFDELDAVPEGIFESTSNDFEVVATVFVTLNYGGRKEQSMSDSYPAYVKGTYDEATQAASIEEVVVDTSSFYE